MPHFSVERFNLNPLKEIEIQGLQWESMQDLLKLKVEMKQYQNINLTIGNLPSFPMVNMHMANDFTNDMKQKDFFFYRWGPPKKK